MRYITGTTALNIMVPGRSLPGWHSSGLVNTSVWQWAGINVRATDHLLGVLDLYDATAILRRYAPDTPGGTLAANYERAVFDLLFDAVSRGCPVPNYQARDIDDVVDFKKVTRWIESADLPFEHQAVMLDWLRRV